MIRLFVTVCLLLINQHTAHCGLVTSDQVDKNFIGCFQLNPCDMDEFTTGHHVVQDTTQSDHYLPTDCVNFCTNFAEGAPFYTFAGTVFKSCYCLDSVKNLKPIGTRGTCDKDCSTGGCYESTKLFIYTLCPFGTSFPPGCTGTCPAHCSPPVPGGASVCDRIGNCIFGCKDNFCNTPTLCETITGGGLTAAKDPTLVLNITKLTIGLSIFPTLCFTASGGGYVRKIEFYGRSKGSAYASVWRKNSTSWNLVWKKLVYGQTDGLQVQYFTPTSDKLNVVRPGDCLGVHLSQSLMTTDITNTSLQPEYSLFYGTNNASAGAGSYMFLANTFDDGWVEGTFKMSTMPNPSQSVYGPSFALSLSCNCSSTCSGGSCNLQGECTQGCLPGYTGTKCDTLCAMGKYGSGCTKGCPANCNTGGSCDPVTGTCLAGCQPGFYGTLCDIPCPDFYWGVNCQVRCGACADITAPCTKTTGVCPNGCRNGFVPPLCVETCPSGFYGNCSSVCGNCKNGVPCHPITGACQGCATGFMMPTCKCAAGKFGALCDQTCGNCLDGKSCNDDDGQCPFGCAIGYQPTLCIAKCNTGTWGANCQTQCGSCAAGATCDPITGACTGGCGPGYSGTNCDIPCNAGMWGQGCTSNCGYCEYSLGYGACRPSDGACMYGCQGGFGLPQCTSCADGFYGDACLKCGECAGGVNCNSDGTCPNGCAPGVYATAGCSTPCPPGTWGINCQQTCGHCARCGVCNPHDGSCTSCQPGYKSPLCVDQCPQGYYGSDCSTKCGTCKNNALCDAVGNCLNGCDNNNIPPLCIMSSCRPGIWGASCTEVCGKCQDGASCNLIDGSCPSGCAAGWKGIYCDQPSPVNQFAIFRIQQCNAGQWGALCDQKCGNCLNGDTCDPADGSCSSGCTLGYNPPNCVDRCPTGKYGERCIMTCGTCLGGDVCSDTDGKCPNGCADGYLPPSCITPCDDGWYGTGCTLQCGHCHGGCRFSDGSCTTGCEAGWEGDKCDISLRSAASSLRSAITLISFFIVALMY